MRPFPRLVRALPLAWALPLAAVPVAGCGSPPGAAPGEGAAVPLERPVARPAAVLPEADGGSYDLMARSGGRLTLLMFGYTYCPDICPVHMANLAAVMRDLPFEVSRQIEVIFVTADPVRDTPERLQSWLATLHPRFVGLRGTREQVTALERALGLPPSVVDSTGGPGGSYFVGHAGQILVFEADDTARVAYPFGTRQRDWLRDLPRLVRGERPLLAPEISTDPAPAGEEP